MYDPNFSLFSFYLAQRNVKTKWKTYQRYVMEIERTSNSSNSIQIIVEIKLKKLIGES